MSVVWTGDETRAEIVRRGSKRDHCLDVLRAAGAAGVLNTTLQRPEIGGSRAGSRVDELRDQGFEIPCVVEDGPRGLYRYTLVREPGPVPPAGKLF